MNISDEFSKALSSKSELEIANERIAELEADIVVRDKALVSRNDEIKGLQNYIKMTNAYPEQVTRMLAEWKQADKEVE